MTTLAGRPPARELALAGATGGVAAMAVVAVAVAPPHLAILGLLALAGGAVLACVRDTRRLLLAALLLDIPLQWDMNFGYRVDAERLGALGGLNVSVTTGALVALYVLWWWERGPRGAGAPPLQLRPARPLLAFVGVEALSLLVARDRVLGAYEVAMLVQTLALFVYVASTVRTRGDVRFLLAALSAVLLLEAALMVALGVVGGSSHVLGLDTTADGTRLGGTVGSPNTAASFLGLLVPLAVAQALLPARGALRLLGAAAAATGVVALLLTGSRGAWIGLVCSSAVLVIGGRRLGLVPTGRVALAALAALVLIVPFAGTIAARATAPDNGSAASRLSMARLASEMIADHPLLGVGVNNVAAAIPDYAGPEFDGQFIYTIHNRYLLAWAEAGVGAVAALVWFLVAALRRAAEGARAADRLVAMAALAAGAAIAAQSVHMLVEIFQSRPQTQGLWLIAALAWALAAMARPAAEGAA